MKTALDLPDDLVRDVKLHAVHKGKKLKDAVADLLRKGLQASDMPPLSESELGVDPTTGLPIVLCLHRALPSDEITPERASDLLLEQEVAWVNEAGRH